MTNLDLIRKLQTDAAARTPPLAVTLNLAPRGFSKVRMIEVAR